jgi:hypothetical protein
LLEQSLRYQQQLPEFQFPELLDFDKAAHVSFYEKSKRAQLPPNYWKYGRTFTQWRMREYDVSELRPGVSPEFLRRLGVVPVDQESASQLLGFAASGGGLWIPYPGLNSASMVVNGRKFGRLRLDKPTSDAKYLSPKESGARVYVPHGPRFGSTLVIVEGEFKAMALCEAGVRAVGIGGISSAMSNGTLIGDLAALLRRHHPDCVYFLGDNDTALNFEFSREAVKLHSLLSKTCKLMLPRIPLNEGKGIDDVRELERKDFPLFWEKIASKAVEGSDKLDPSSLALRLLEPEWPTIEKDKNLFLPKLIALGGDLILETALDELAQRVKKHFEVNISAFKADATKRKHEQASNSGLPLPATFYFDGVGYYRPSKDSAFERISREDTMLALRSAGYWHRMASGCELTPCEVVLHRVQTEHRIDYAGPICGRPPGLWQEGGSSVLCTRGPIIIPSSATGDAAPMLQFLKSLFGEGRDSFFEQQLTTFIGWVRHAREAVRNHQQHLPGHVLGLVGPADCGKSLCQSLITQCLGGREADAALWLVKGNDFNSDLWAAEHLRLGDEELSEDHRRRHGLRDRLKKITTADVYPLHAKFRDAKSFRPIWRATLSANDDDRRSRFYQRRLTRSLTRLSTYVATGRALRITMARSLRRRLSGNSSSRASRRFSIRSRLIRFQPKCVTPGFSSKSSTTPMWST